MSSKVSLRDQGFVFAMTAAAVTVVASSSSFAQAALVEGSSSIELSSAALNLRKPAFATRAERLNAKPLEWNSTIGTPTPRELTPAETEALRNAQPGSASGGPPQQNAEEEARKLYPEDWK